MKNLPMKRIELPCYDIVVVTDGTSAGSIDSGELDRFAHDGILSLILAHACAGIDITTPAYLEGIETAVQNTN